MRHAIADASYETVTYLMFVAQKDDPFKQTAILSEVHDRVRRT